MAKVTEPCRFQSNQIYSITYRIEMDSIIKITDILVSAYPHLSIHSNALNVDIKSWIIEISISIYYLDTPIVNFQLLINSK